jgi:RNA polymerase sigma-70 factor (ECF subfamily)
MSSKPSAAARFVAPRPQEDHHGEADLVLALRRGDEDAFERLVREQGPRLLSVTRSLLRDASEAEDAVQEAFLAAVRSIHRFSGASRLSTWLHRIAVNAALMKLRRSTRRPEVSIETLLPRFEGAGRHEDAIEDWSDEAERALLREETRAQVRAAIESLPISHRTVLVLRDIQELSTEETGRLLALTPTAVKIRLHRARMALRTQLTELFRSPERPACCPVH